MHARCASWWQRASRPLLLRPPRRCCISRARIFRAILPASLPRAACDAFAANRVDAVLHYSIRSAKAFLEAARAAGVEISALAVPQCCISGAVASVVRDAGAAQVVVAASPDEIALFEVLDRALRAVPR